MSDPKKRTPPANAGGAYDERSEDSVKWYPRSLHSGKADPACHWAKGENCRVLSLDAGNVRILALEGSKGVALWELRKGVDPKKMGTARYSSLSEAQLFAESLPTTRAGLDMLGRANQAWRLNPVTTAQLRRLNVEGITLPPEATSGDASDELVIADVVRIMTVYFEMRRRERNVVAP
jgi:hypothetical protein